MDRPEEASTTRVQRTPASRARAARGARVDRQRAGSALALAVAALVVAAAALAAIAPAAVAATPCRPVLADAPLAPVERGRSASAEDGVESLPVSPATILVDEPVVAGSRIECVVRVDNKTGAAVRVIVDGVAVVGVDDADRAAQYVEADAPGGAGHAATWVTPPADAVELAPGSFVRIPVAIDVPAGAEPMRDTPGIAIEFEPVAAGGEAAADPDASRLGVRQRIVVPVLATINGHPGEPELMLDDLAAPTVRWSRESWALTGRVRNEGARFAVPDGEVRIVTLWGSTVARLAFTTTTLLPGGGAPLEVEWRRVPWFGVYRVEVEAWDVQSSRATSDVVARRWLVALPPWWLLAAILGAVALWLLVRRRLAARAAAFEGYDVDADAHDAYDLDADHDGD